MLCLPGDIQSQEYLQDDLLVKTTKGRQENPRDETTVRQENFQDEEVHQDLSTDRSDQSAIGETSWLLDMEKK